MSLQKHLRASERKGISYLVSKILCVFFSHLARKLNARADAKHTINFKRPYIYIYIHIPFHLVDNWIANDYFLIFISAKEI